MKKSFLLSVIFILLNINLYSQIEEIRGKPVVELYTDFHYNINGDSAKTSGFAVNRAYFGYNYAVDENFATTVIIDIGTPEDLAIGSTPRRYAHFREASISYTGEKLDLTIGITGTRIFSYQQKFWGKRYVANTFQSIHGYGYVADLGLVADYKLNNWLQADISLMNGKGYSNIQMDNTLKASVGITITPPKMFSIRVYSDLMKHAGVWQNTLIGFAGFRNELLYIGAEFSYKTNLDLKEGHHAWGFSSTGGVNILKNTELFIRYDNASSIIPEGEAMGWDYQKDGTFLIGGIQYSFNKAIKMSADYQSFFPDDPVKVITSYIFLNFLVKF